MTGEGLTGAERGQLAAAVDMVTWTMPRKDAGDLLGWLRHNRPLGMPDSVFDGLLTALETPDRPECNWPRCHRSPNACFAWCKCVCHDLKHRTHSEWPRDGSDAQDVLADVVAAIVAERVAAALSSEMERLRELAEAATPGPWSAADEHGLLGPDASPAWCVSRMRPGYESMTPTEGYMYDVAETSINGRPESEDGPNAAYIAAASPDVVLRLLDALDLCREAIGPAATECGRLGLPCTHVNPEGNWCLGCQLRAALAAADPAPERADGAGGEG